MPDPGDVERVAAAVLARRKYRALLPAFVESVARRALEVHGGRAAAERATRSKLHQMTAVYAPGVRWERWAERLAEAAARGELRGACRRALVAHASTRERAPIVETFYRTLFERLGRVGCVLDLACGLHPLAAPWMPLRPDVRYLACDVDRELLGLIRRFFALAGIDGEAFSFDLTTGAPPHEADVALLLKSLPCLEQLDPEAGRRLLRDVRARRVVVSFPVGSLTGRGKGMRQSYDRYLRALLADAPWRFERLDFASELVFVIEKS